MDDVGHFAGDDVAVMVMIFLDRLIFVQNKKVSNFSFKANKLRREIKESAPTYNLV